jgi:pimeloyl-ACP methyl ester carboxylesterase
MEKVLDNPAEKMFYRIVGNGTPVVFLHGFGEDGSVWDAVVDGIKHNYQCIIPDLPGSGQSLLKEGKCSMESLAESIRRIFIEEQLEKAILVGHSMGGYISLAFAEKYAELLKGFALFHSSAFADNDEKKTTRKRGIEFIQEHGAAKFLEQATPKLFSEDFKEKHAEIVQQLIERFTNFDDSSLVHYYQAMMERPDRTAVLSNFSGPILFILGEHDTAIPLSDGLKQCHLPRLSYIHILRNSGHMGMIEETNKAINILVKFLQDLLNGNTGILAGN